MRCFLESFFCELLLSPPPGSSMSVDRTDCSEPILELDPLSKWMLSRLPKCCVLLSSTREMTAMVVFSGAELGLDTDGRSLNFMEASSMSLGVPGRGMESSSISYSLTEDRLLLGEVECTSIPCLSPSSIGMTQNWVVVICGLKDEWSKVSTNQRATYSCWTAKLVLTGGLVPKTSPSPSPLPPPRPRLPDHRSAPELHEQTTQ